MNEKGFTLTELLATITIMGVLAAIAVGSVYIYATNSREQALETIETTSYDGAVNYMMEHNILLSPGESETISITTLFEEGYIERPTDPDDNSKDCTGTVVVTNEESSGVAGLDDYTYEVQVKCSEVTRDKVTY